MLSRLDKEQETIKQSVETGTKALDTVRKQNHKQQYRFDEIRANSFLLLLLFSNLKKKS